MRNSVNIILVAAMTAFIAHFLGWVAVPVVALIVSIGARELKLRPWQVGAGCALAWAVLLALSARAPAFSGLLTSLAAVFQIPGFALVFVALLLPFALGWSTSVLASAVIKRGDR